MEYIPEQDCISNLPSWAKGMGNVKNLQGQWIVGVVRHKQEVEDVIEDYCMSLPCDFVKRYPSNMAQKHLKNSEGSRVLWQMKDVPFTGIPFSIVSHDVLICTFSQNVDPKKRRKVNSVSSSSKLDKNKTSSEKVETKKCPANIIVKKIIRYLSYVAPINATKLEKISKLKQLKDEMGNGEPVTETVFWLRFPLSFVHNHDFRGSDRFIHSSLRMKMREYITAGVTSPEHLKSLLSNYVHERFINRSSKPLPDDEAYYPNIRRVHYTIFNLTTRMKGEGLEKGNRREDQEIFENERERNRRKKLMSLTDLVQEFCSDSVTDVVESNPKGGTPDTALLKEQVLEKLNNLIQISQSLNDPLKLQELLDLLSSFEVKNDDKSSDDEVFSLSSAVEENSKENYAPLNEIFAFDSYFDDSPRVIQIDEYSEALPV